jgi:hypothetical protein
MEIFKNMLEDCRLCDLGFFRPKFTWTNKRYGKWFTQEQMDRKVANQEWCALYNTMEVSVLAARSSDHSPLLIQ